MKNKQKIVFIIIISFILSIISSCKQKNSVDENKQKLYVYNWGLYIDEDVIPIFEKKYNVDVVYDMFDTNEEMFSIVDSGARVYDVICPTDYMIEKMIRKNMLLDFDFKTLENYKNIDQNVLNIMKSFDNENKYAVPYVYSTIGLIYNKTLLDEKQLLYPTKWSDLWDEKYKNEILMQDAMRDLLMVGLKKNHFSMNTLDKNELDIATKDLIDQKPLVQSYVIDQVRDKMVGGEAAIGVTYSGEVMFIKNETQNTDYKYDYVLPEEGVNLTIDAWVIPKNAQNVDLAKKWIDFICDKNIALKNFNVMTYGLPNVAAMNEIDDNLLNDEAVFPNLNDISKYELYKDLGEYEEVYNDCFKKIKS